MHPFPSRDDVWWKNKTMSDIYIFLVGRNDGRRCVGCNKRKPSPINRQGFSLSSFSRWNISWMTIWMRSALDNIKSIHQQMEIKGSGSAWSISIQSRRRRRRQSSNSSRSHVSLTFHANEICCPPFSTGLGRLQMSACRWICHALLIVSLAPGYDFLLLGGPPACQIQLNKIAIDPKRTHRHTDSWLWIIIVFFLLPSILFFQ